MNRDQIMEILKMKKAILATLSILAVCSLCFAGTVSAIKAGYGCQNCLGDTDITIDGKYTAADEWTMSYKDWLYDGWTMTTSIWRIRWSYNPMISDKFIVEFVSDTTNDPGDYFTLCYDGGGGFGTPPEGGTAPQENDYKVTRTGHATTTVSRGSGTGWVAATDVVIPDQVEVKDTLTATALSDTQHWVIEVTFDKSGDISGTGIDTGIRLAVYDASTGKTLMWPPMTSGDVPDDFGYCAASMTMDVPEGLTIGVMVLVSTVAVIVGTRYFRKRPKWEKW